MKNYRIVAILVVGVLSLSALGIYLYVNPQLVDQAEQKEAHIAFVAEVYEQIKESYWSKVDDNQLSNIYKLAAEKVSEETQTLISPDLAGVEEMVRAIIADKSDEDKTKFVAQISDVVLANLEPFGRSRLYSEKQEEELRNAVENINPDKDLYATLGVEKDASPQEIEEAYQVKSAEATPEEKEEIAYAKDVLVDEDKRERYDESGAEPTTSARLITPSIAYIRLDRFSPATFDEFRNDDRSQAGQLARDELDVGEVLEPPEDRHPSAVPLRVVRLVVRIAGAPSRPASIDAALVAQRFPQGISNDLNHSPVALTL